eukprot:2392685-Pyramimonas_sp.AAC.1
MLICFAEVPRMVLWHTSRSSNSCLPAGHCRPMKREVAGRVYSNIVDGSWVFIGPSPSPPSSSSSSSFLLVMHLPPPSSVRPSVVVRPSNSPPPSPPPHTSSLPLFLISFLLLLLLLLSLLLYLLLPPPPLSSSFCFGVESSRALGFHALVQTNNKHT